MTANGSKPYLDYLNKLVEMNIAILVITGKKPINANYFALTEETESNHKAPKFKASDRVRITKYKNIFSKGYPKIGHKKYLWLILCWKLILGHIRLNIWTKK